MTAKADSFNSRPRTTGDGPGERDIIARNEFQFTPAHDGRRGSRLGQVYPVRFNSRPRTTGDQLESGQWVRDTVSIHARARRATVGSSTNSPGSLFQFTPAHDGRPQVLPMSMRLQCFNSRPRTTGDAMSLMRCLPHFGFNSRPRTTGDVHGTRRASHPNMFQFTPAHDGRL